LSTQGEKAIVNQLHFIADSSRNMEMLIERMEITGDRTANLIEAILDRLETMDSVGGSSTGGKASKADDNTNKNLKGIAESMDAIVKSLKDFSKIKGAAADSFVKFVGGLSDKLATLDYEKIQKGADSMSAMAKGLAVLGLSLVVSTVAFAIGGVGLLIIIPTVAILGILFETLGRLGKNIEKGAESVITMGIGLASLALGILAFKLVDIKPVDVLTAVATVAVTALVFGIAGKFAPEIFEGAIVMGLSGIALIVLAAGIVIFKQVDLSLEDVGIMSAAIIGVGLGMAAAGLASAFIVPGALSLIFAGISLMVLTAGLAVFRTMDYKEEDTELIKTAIMGVSEGFAYAGLMSPVIILGSVALILASVSMMLLTGAVALYRKLDYKPEDTETLTGLVTGVGDAFSSLGLSSITVVIGAAAMLGAAISMITLTAALFLFKKVDWSDKLNDLVSSTITGVSKAFVNDEIDYDDVFEGVKSVRYAGAALYDIAEGLIEFEKLKVDPVSLATKIGMVLGVVRESFAAIGGSTKNSTFLGFIPTSKNLVEEGISAVSDLGDTLVDIAQGVQSFAELKFTNAQGKEVSLTPAMLEQVGTNIGIVLGVVSKAFEEIGKKDDSGWFKTGAVAKGVNAVKGIGKELAAIAAGVQGFANLSFKGADGKPVNMSPDDIKKVSVNIKDIITSVSEAFIKIGSGEAKSEGWFNDGDLKKGVASIKGAGTEVKNIAESIKALSEVKDIKKTSDSLQMLISMVPRSIIESMKGINADTFKLQVSALSMANQPIENIINLLSKMKDKKIDQKDASNLSKSISSIFSSITGAKLDKNTFNSLDKVTVFIDKLTAAVDPMEKLAKSMGIIASSVEKTGISFTQENKKQPVARTSSINLNNVTPAPVSPQYVKGESSVPITPIKQIQTPQAVDTTPVLMKGFEDLSQQIIGLKSAMKQVVDTLNGELKVRPVTGNGFGG
jgi:MFS family permease